MRAPHHFLTSNLILRTPTDAWAIYELGIAWRERPYVDFIEVVPTES